VFELAHFSASQETPMNAPTTISQFHRPPVNNRMTDCNVSSGTAVNKNASIPMNKPIAAAK
jgi:hypothetical protein